MAETKATDEAEDELYGEARGDELSEQLRTSEGRREFFRQARRARQGQHERDELTDEPEAETSAQVALEFDADRIVERTQGRQGWVREGRRQLERHRWRHRDPVPRSRHERLLLAAQRLESRS